MISALIWAARAGLAAVPRLAFFAVKALILVVMFAIRLAWFLETHDAGAARASVREFAWSVSEPFFELTIIRYLAFVVQVITTTYFASIIIHLIIAQKTVAAPVVPPGVPRAVGPAAPLAPPGVNPLIAQILIATTVKRVDMQIAALSGYETLMTGGRAVDLVTRLAKTRAGIVADKLRPLSRGFPARVAHMKAVFLRAVAAQTLLDFEGINTGLMLAPADLVYEEGGLVVLEDVTSDRALVAAKLSALQAKCDALRVSFGRLVAIPRVFVHREDADGVVDTLNVGVAESELFKAIADLSEAVADASLDPEPYINALYNSMVLPEKPAVEQPPDVIESCKRLATGKEVAGDVTKVLGTITETYPKLKAVALSVGARVGSIAKGLPPPSEAAPPITASSESWAGLLGLAKEIAEGEAAGWSAGEDARICSLDAPLDVVLRKTKGSYFTIKLGPSAPKEWVDMVSRKGGSGAREALAPLSEADVESEYRKGNEILSEFASETRGGATSLLSAARALLTDINFPDFAHRCSGNMAKHILDGLSKTLGFQSLATSQAAISAATLAASAGTREEFRLVDYFGGRMLVLAKKTGNISADNDSRVLAAISGPIGPVMSWEAARTTNTSLSKCIFASARLRNHLDHSIGAAATIAASYADGSTDMAVGIAAGAAFSATCMGANKAFGVALSAERALSEGVCAISNSTDDVAKKFSETKPGSSVEATVLLRVLLRSAACAVMRDTGSLADLIVPNNTGTTSPIYVPAFASRGLFTYTGFINAVYDYAVGSGEAPSVIRNEAKAFMGVFDEVNDFKARVAAGDQSIWCMSHKTLAAWRAGNLRQFVRTREFEEAEKDFIRYITPLARRHTASTVLMVSFAKEYADKTGLPAKVAACVERVAKQELKEFVSNKSACERENLTKDRASSPAYRTVTRYCAEILGMVSKTFTSDSIWGFITSEMGKTTAAISVLATIALGRDEDFVVIAKGKDLTVEKTRDFFMMSANMRMTQSVTEKVSREVGRHIEWSALAEPSKIMALNKIIDSRAASRRHLVATMTDKTRYGPSRIPGLLYGVMYASGLTGGARDLYRICLSKTRTKRVRPSDQLINATADQIADVERSVAPGISALLNEALQSPDRCIEVITGTGQGLTQSTSDVFTAYATGITERVAHLALGFCKAISTNDDGVTLTETRAADAWQHASDICEITVQTGFATGEVSNRSKVLASTWGINLNTQFRAIGDRVGRGRGALPWARELMSITGPSASSSLKESAYEALTKTNGALDEGAPAMALMLASAIAQAAHYQRFRHLTEAIQGAYLGSVPSTLGPPIFAPYYVRALGPAAVEVAFESMRTGESTLTLAQATMAKRVLTATAEIGSLEWVAGASADGGTAGFEDYVLFTMPTSKVKGDRELADLVEKMSADAYGKDVQPNSFEESVAERLLELRDFSVDNLVKSMSTSVQWAASSYALENARVRVISAVFENASVVQKRSTITLQEMKERLRGGRPDLGGTPLATWGVTRRVKDNADFIIAHLNAAPRNLKAVATTQRYYVRQIGFFSGHPSSEEKAALSIMVAPSRLKGFFCFQAAKEGVLTIPYIAYEEAASLKERVAVRTAVTQLTNSVYVRNPPPVITNEAVDLSGLAAYLRTIPMADLGVSLRLVSVGPMIEPPPPPLQMTMEEGAIMDRLSTMVPNDVARLILFKRPTERPDKVVAGTAFTEGTLDMEDDAGGAPGSLSPASSYDLKRILLRLAQYNTRTTLSGTIASAVSESRISTVLRRRMPSVSIRYRRDIVVETATGALPVAAAESRVDMDDNTYMRVVTVFVPTEERLIVVGVDGGDEVMTADEEPDGSWFLRMENKLIHFRILRPSDEVTISVAAYPPCLVATSTGPGSLREIILGEVPRGLGMTGSFTLPTVPALSVRPPAREVREAAIRAAQFISNLNGMPEAMASKATALNPADVVEAVLEELLRVDVEYISTWQFRDVWGIISDLEGSDERPGFIGLLTATLVAMDIFGGAYILFPGSDGADIRRHTRYALYMGNHIARQPDLGLVDVPLGDIAGLTAEELLDVVIRQAENANEAYGDEDLAILTMGELGAEDDEIALGLMNPETSLAAALALGLTPNLSTLEVLTSSVARGAATTQDVALPRAFARIDVHAAVIDSLAASVANMAIIVASRLSTRYGTSAVALTSADMAGLSVGPDALFAAAASHPIPVAAALTSISPNASHIRAAKVRAAARASITGRPEVNAAEGLRGHAAISYEEARSRGMVRSINPASVRRRVEAGAAATDDLSSLTYIGSYGEVRLGLS